MLNAYCDASGTHDGSQVLVVAGLLSTPTDWEELSCEWQEVLNSEGLTDFHASDCATGGRAFKDREVWPDQRRQSLYMKLARIVAARARLRSWAAVVIEDYKIVLGDSKLAFGICAGCCAQQACLHALAEGPDATIAYVFDQGDRDGPHAFDAFDEMMSRGSNEFRIGTLSKGDRRLIFPLQAADLHAYEVYRFLSDQVLSTKDGKNRTIRAPLLELLTIAEALPWGGHILVGESLDIMRRHFLTVNTPQHKDLPRIPTYKLDMNTQPRLRRDPGRTTA